MRSSCPSTTSARLSATERRGVVAAAVLAFALASALTRDARAESRVLAFGGGRVPPRVFAELEARGVTIERVSGALPAQVAPGTKALRAREGGRVLEVWVARTGESGWDLRAEIPFARSAGDESAVRAAEAIRAAESGSGAREPPPPPSAASAAPPPTVPPAALPPAPVPLPAPATPPALPPPELPELPPQADAFAAPHRPAAGYAAPDRDAARGASEPGRARPQTERLSPFEIGAGLGVQVSPTGAIPIAELTARVWWSEAFGVGIFARPALATATVDDAIGSAELYGIHAGGALLYAPPWASERALALGPEIGVGVVTSTGEADTPYRGLSEADAGLSLALRVELRHVWSPSWSLGLSLLGGTVAPPIEVRFDGEARARWDAPFGAALVGGAFRGL